MEPVFGSMTPESVKLVVFVCPVRKATLVKPTERLLLRSML
jgi:hypothetical protein